MPKQYRAVVRPPQRPSL